MRIIMQLNFCCFILLFKLPAARVLLGFLPSEQVSWQITRQNFLFQARQINFSEQSEHSLQLWQYLMADVGSHFILLLKANLPHKNTQIELPLTQLKPTIVSCHFVSNFILSPNIYLLPAVTFFLLNIIDYHSFIYLF